MLFFQGIYQFYAYNLKKSILLRFQNVLLLELFGTIILINTRLQRFYLYTSPSTQGFVTNQVHFIRGWSRVQNCLCCQMYFKPSLSLSLQSDCKPSFSIILLYSKIFNCNYSRCRKNSMRHREEYKFQNRYSFVNLFIALSNPPQFIQIERGNELLKFYQNAYNIGTYECLLIVIVSQIW